MSRQITNNAVNAFLNDQNFSSSNTQVKVKDNVTVLLLHGNEIAFKHDNGKLQITNAGWFSNTTKERLNSLPNVHIQQKKGIWYLNNTEWDGKLIEVK